MNFKTTRWLALLSLLIASAAFPTQKAQAQCNYSIDLIDSFGDGWNGASMDVLVNGTVVLDDITLSSGSSTTVAFPVNTTDDITTIWVNDGSFLNETSWEIKDATGAVVASAAGGSAGDIPPGTLSATCPACPAPTALVATPSPTDVSVAFTGSASATGGYTVTITGPGGPFTNTGASSPIVVSGLTPASAYSVTVDADCGANGTSTGGPASFVTLPLPPGCGGKFYDSGGPSANYSNNESITTTISPDVAGEVVTVTFNSFNTEGGFDFLSVYNGSDNSAPLLGTFDGNISIGPFTSSDPSGELTFVFVSDGSATRAGWDADVTCALPPSCPVPSAVSTSAVTASSVDVNFTAPSGQTAFEAGVFVSGADPATATPLFTATGSASPISVPGLTAGTPYDAYARTDCSASSSGFSDWTGPAAFTTSPPAPTNDDCGSAFALTVNSDLACGSVTSGTIAGATASPESATACSGTEDDDVWFSFVATAISHTINLSNITGGTTDLYHSLWTGGCGSLSLVPGTCSDPNSSQPAGLVIGTTYFLRVYSWTSTNGQTSVFDVCIGTPPPPPANDECINATPIAVQASGDCAGNETTINLGSATDSQAGNPTCDNVGTNLDVWYTFTAPATGGVIFNTNTTTSEVAVFDDCAQTNELFCSSSSTDGKSVTGLTPGSIYTLNVWQDDGNAGSDFTLCLEAIAACQAPTGLSASNVTDMTADLSFTANDLGAHTIEYAVAPITQGATGNLTVNLGTGVTTAGLTGLTALTTYEFIVTADCGSAPSATGSFTTLATPPANDACAGAIAILDGQTINGNTTSSTNVESLAACSGGAIGASCITGVNDGTIDFTAGVWFVYTSLAVEDITIDVTGFDTELQVFTGSCGALTCVAGDDDSNPGGGFGSRVCFESTASASRGGAAAPVDYYIYVDGHSGATGAFSLSLTTFGVPLPVELTNFNAYATEKGNRVEWTAASEVDFYMYTVERATNPRSFAAFAQVAPTGTNYTEAVYTSTDLNPAKTTYYRLRMENLDGSVEYSDVVSVSRDDVRGGIHFFPNPAHERVSFEVLPGTVDGGTITVILTDLNGRVIREWNLAEGQRTDVDVSNIPSGVYLVSSVNATSSQSQRLIIE